MVEYTSSRLCFKADLIEPLNDNDSFIVYTPNGTFKFTKADFYHVFSNVIGTKSYQEGRLYQVNPRHLCSQKNVCQQKILWEKKSE